jgi:hypothetical protein
MYGNVNSNTIIGKKACGKYKNWVLIAERHNLPQEQNIIFYFGLLQHCWLINDEFI